ncbi:MAG: lipopolysaccharide kinase InaA family protein [Planctomycetota bacterium]
MATHVEWESGVAAPSGEEGWRLLMDLRHGLIVALSRTTRTEHGYLELPSGTLSVHRKIYDYETIGSRLKGAFRTTFAAPSRARRELDAIRRLRALGEPFLAPAPVVLAERRTAGLLEIAVVATATIEDGAPLDDLEPDETLAEAVGRAVARMHEASFARLDIAPRNFVASRAPDGQWAVAKVDTGRLRETDASHERARDLAGLLAGLEVAWTSRAREIVRESYEEHLGSWPKEFDAALRAAKEQLRRRDPR